MERAIHILLYSAVATTLFSTAGVLVMKDVTQKLHSLAPPATLGIALITIAIIMKEGASQITAKAIFCALIVIVTNPVLAHAIARAARIRESGEWFTKDSERDQAG